MCVLVGNEYLDQLCREAQAELDLHLLPICFHAYVCSSEFCLFYYRKHKERGQENWGKESCEACREEEVNTNMNSNINLMSPCLVAC